MAEKYPLRLNSLEVMPDFSLPSSQGTPTGLWSYKQRRNLVIFFFEYERCRECRDKLREFARHYDRYQELETVVLAITTTDEVEVTRLARELQLPYPLLADPAGNFIRRLVEYDTAAGPPSAAVFVADRFGAVYEQEVATNAGELLTQEEILDWVFFIDSQCPECTVPEWPAPTA